MLTVALALGILLTAAASDLQLQATTTSDLQEKRLSTDVQGKRLPSQGTLYTDRTTPRFTHRATSGFIHQEKSSPQRAGNKQENPPNEEKPSKPEPQSKQLANSLKGRQSVQAGAVGKDLQDQTSIDKQADHSKDSGRSSLNKVFTSLGIRKTKVQDGLNPYYEPQVGKHGRNKFSGFDKQEGTESDGENEHFRSDNITRKRRLAARNQLTVVSGQSGSRKNQTDLQEQGASVLGADLYAGDGVSIHFRRVPLAGQTVEQKDQWRLYCSKCSQHGGVSAASETYDDECFDDIAHCPWCNCLNKQPCDVRTAQCVNSKCAYGWKTASCRQSVCSGHSYAPHKNCSLACKENCRQSAEVCHPITGECLPLRHSHMQRLCPRKLFYQHCSHRCRCWGDRMCDPESGECPEGVCMGLGFGRICRVDSPSFWLRRWNRIVMFVITVIVFLKGFCWVLNSARSRRDFEL